MASSPAPAEACTAAPRAPVVLVTGASGLVGRALRAEVEAQQQQAQEPDDGGIAKFATQTCDANAKWVWLSSKDGDLTDADATAAIFERHRPSHVIHLAAHVGGLFANMASACSAPCEPLQRADAAAAQANNLLFYQRNTAMCGAPAVHGRLCADRKRGADTPRRGQERPRAAAVRQAPCAPTRGGRAPRHAVRDAASLTRIAASQASRSSSAACPRVSSPTRPRIPSMRP